jgi:RNA polymerase sigma-70 factor, ECF subfamily
MRTRTTTRLDFEAMSDSPHLDLQWQRSADLQARQNEFVQVHLRRVFLIIYRIVGDVTDAQDLTQETFIKALQRQDQLKDLDKAAHWLSRIATNTALDFLRRRGRYQTTAIESIQEPLATSEFEDPEVRLLRREQHDRLNSLLACLTPRERLALVLRDVEGLPAEEVAARLNCGKATVRSHIANARIKFKKLLGRAKR